MKSTTAHQFIQQAQHLCGQRGTRLTPQRLTIFQLMLQQEGAISAYELLERLQQTEPNAKPPTIYRALEFLLEQGLIHRVESTNSYIVCYHFTEIGHASTLFICDQCHQVTEQTTGQITTVLTQLAQQQGFHIHHSIIEVHGHCAGCLAKQN